MRSYREETHGIPFRPHRARRPARGAPDEIVFTGGCGEAHNPAPGLEALAGSPEIHKGAIRVGPGRGPKADEIETVVRRLTKVVASADG